MSKSEEKTDIWGDKYTVHYDDDGNKIGESREKTDIWGDSYTEHTDTTGHKTGVSVDKTDIWGDHYVQHTDAAGNKTAESRNKTDIWGDRYIEHRQRRAGEDAHKAVTKERSSKSVYSKGTSGSGSLNNSLTHGSPFTPVWVLILFLLAVGVYFYFSSTATSRHGEWPDDLSGGLMYLKAGERSKVWGGTMPGMGYPNCFIWSAPGGAESVKFIAQVTESRDTRNWTTKPMTEGEFNHCNYYGTMMSFRIIAESTIDQSILVGWETLSPKSDLRPGYNNHNKLAAHFRVDK